PMEPGEALALDDPSDEALAAAAFLEDEDEDEGEEIDDFDDEPIEPEIIRDWMTSVPQTWLEWTALRDEICESPASRRSFRNWMMNKLEEDQHLERGLGLAAAGENAQALAELNQADGDLPKLLAAECLSHTDFVGAETALKGLTSSAAVGFAARLKLAEVHFHTHNAEGLGADVAAIEGEGGSAADKAYITGLLAETEGDHDGALTAWQAALEADGDHVQTTFRLAALLDRFGDDDEAMSLLDRFRSGELPSHTGALMNLGVLYEDRDLYDWAATCFGLVVANEPNNVVARRCLTDAHASLVQYHDESQERKADKQNAVLRIPVTDFELSVRARNCLQRMNLHTLGDLVNRTESELLSFKNFGETSLEEVKQILAMKGLRLGMITGSGSVIEAAVSTTESSSSSSGDVKDLNVSELDLSVRSRAALATLGVTRVDDLCRTTETTLLSCKNFGQTSLDEIRSKLRNLGMDLTG
ncbi:MAG: DNA-directed RNA polymerase subunit alpha, partial [Pseudohongiellaceae bacterium]